MTRVVPGRKASAIFLACLFSLQVFYALAQEAPSTAADPILEKRVMRLSEELRCLVCQNQSLSDSNAELAIEGFSGATVVTLPADLNATISVETHSGSIRSDFGDDRVRTEKYGPGAWLETEVGDGSAEIEISSFSGSVKLSKR